MRNKAADAAQMEIKRNDFLKTGFRLFSEKSIETVTLTQVAEAAGYGQTTIRGGCRHTEVGAVQGGK